MAHLGAQQVLGDDADHAAPGAQRRVREDAHQPDPAAAEDELDARRRQQPAEPRRGVAVRARAAIGRGTGKPPR